MRPISRLIAAATLAALPAALLSGLPAASASTRTASAQAAATAPGGGFKNNDYTGDGKADIVVRDRHGVLWIYPGTGRSTAPFFGARRYAGSGWSYNLTLAAGDLTGDGKADVVARDYRGYLWVYPGNGNITSGASWGRRVNAGSGTGWLKIYTLMAPGDFDGDGKADLLGYDWWGNVRLYSGDGHGHFAGSRVIGKGFNGTTTAVGDVTGDGHPDLFFLQTYQYGRGWVYPGNGTGGLLPKQDTGTMWATAFRIFVGPGDFNGDGRPDLITRGDDGMLWLYPFRNGRPVTGARIGSGWDQFSDITS